MIKVYKGEKKRGNYNEIFLFFFWGGFFGVFSPLL